MKYGFVAAILTLTSFSASAQDFSAGEAAFSIGDYAAAMQIWRPLAEAGNVEAQVRLGLMYEGGRGVPQDRTEAMSWYRLAAEQGNPFAQLNLGWMYEAGEGVPQNYSEAVSYYLLAAQNGAPAGLFSLCQILQRAPYDEHSLLLAHMWCNLSAASGEPLAIEQRENIETLMTSEQISDAQRRATVCWETRLKDC